MTDGSNVRSGKGPRIDPDAMPPEELARLKGEGYGHLIAHRTKVLDLTHPQDPPSVMAGPSTMSGRTTSPTTLTTRTGGPT